MYLTYIFSLFAVKPHIDRSSLKDIVVKAGQPVTIELSMIGEPPPEKIWTFGTREEPVEDESRKGRVHIKKDDYRIKMNITDTKRKDTGPYKLTAKNSSGSDTVTVNVTVLCKFHIRISNPCCFCTNIRKKDKIRK